MYDQNDSADGKCDSGKPFERKRGCKWCNYGKNAQDHHSDCKRDIPSDVFVQFIYVPIRDVSCPL